MNRPIAMTDTQGRVLAAAGTEPEPSSVVLTNGEHGTAWQRFFSDGLWHSSRGGVPRRWARMLTERNLVLIYDAPVRDRHEAQAGALR